VAKNTLNAFRELDNAISTTIGPVTRFNHTWSREKRENAIRQMEILADTEAILPRARELLTELEEKAKEQKQISSEGTEAIDAVLACGQRALELLGNSVETPWHGAIKLAEMIDAIFTADSPEASESVREKAKIVQSVVDRKLLGKADLSIGRFRGIS